MRTLFITILLLRLWCQDSAQLSVNSLLSLKEIAGEGIIYLYHSDNDPNTQVSLSDGTERSIMLRPDAKGRYELRWDILKLYADGKVTTNKAKGSMRLNYMLNDHRIKGIIVDSKGQIPSSLIAPHYRNAIGKSEAIAKALGVPIPEDVVVWLKSSNYNEYSCSLGEKSFQTKDGTIYISVSAKDIISESGIIFSKTDIQFE